MHYIECGSCGQYHRKGYLDDCRNDNERFTWDDIENGATIVELTYDDKGNPTYEPYTKTGAGGIDN